MKEDIVYKFGIKDQKSRMGMMGNKKELQRRWQSKCCCLLVFLFVLSCFELAWTAAAIRCSRSKLIFVLSVESVLATDDF
jgi:hypothetical protein